MDPEAELAGLVKQRGDGKRPNEAYGKTAKIVVVAALVILGAFVALMAVWKFPLRDWKLNLVAAGAFCVGVYMMSAGVLRVIDPSIPMTFTRTARERVWTGRGNMIVEEQYQETKRVHPVFAAGYAIVGLLICGVPFGLLWYGHTQPVREAADKARRDQRDADAKLRKEQHEAAAANTPQGKLKTATTFRDAIAALKPEMKDAKDKISDAAGMLGSWASEHLKWSEVGVATNETSIAAVQRDADPERGKLMCASGEVAKLSKDTFSGTVTYSAYVGAVKTADGILSVIAVGSVDDLPVHTRFCGAVIGNFENIATPGAEKRTVSIVGMFDIPANKH